MTPPSVFSSLLSGKGGWSVVHLTVCLDNTSLEEMECSG